jgi:hypothetical protein
MAQQAGAGLLSVMRRRRAGQRRRLRRRRASAVTLLARVLSFCCFSAWRAVYDDWARWESILWDK